MYLTIKKVSLIVSLFSLISCSSYNRSLKIVKEFGGYTTKYFEQTTLPSDSISIQIELYSYESKKPIDFGKSQFTLNEYQNKNIDGNLCIAYFKRAEVPTQIFIHNYELNKNSIIISNHIQKNKSVIYKVYLVDNKYENISI